VWLFVDVVHGDDFWNLFGYDSCAYVGDCLVREIQRRYNLSMARYFTVNENTRERHTIE
jgi:hypothetical protein